MRMNEYRGFMNERSGSLTLSNGFTIAQTHNKLIHSMCALTYIILHYGYLYVKCCTSVYGTLLGAWEINRLSIIITLKLAKNPPKFRQLFGALQD